MSGNEFRETYWYSSLALEVMDMNELVRTLMSIVLKNVSAKLQEKSQVPLTK
jgi:hypothetical protein